MTCVDCVFSVIGYLLIIYKNRLSVLPFGGVAAIDFRYITERCVFRGRKSINLRKNGKV